MHGRVMHRVARVVWRALCWVTMDEPCLLRTLVGAYNRDAMTCFTFARWAAGHTKPKPKIKREPKCTKPAAPDADAPSHQWTGAKNLAAKV